MRRRQRTRTDIADRKRVETQLEESRRLYKELVDSLDGIVWEADAKDFRFTFVSKQCERLLGYSPERWLNEVTWQKLIHPEDRDYVFDTCGKATEEKRNHSLEYRVIAADGRVVWVRDIATVIVENDRPVKLCGVLLDNTERKQMEQQLRQADKLAALGKLLDGVSHELNNPLFILIGYTQLVGEKVKHGQYDGLGKDLAAMHEAALRAKGIVDRFLAVARSSGGRRLPCAVNELLQQTLGLMSNDFAIRNITVVTDFARHLPLVLADPQGLTQVFLNVIANARDAMAMAHGRGALTVSTVLRGYQTRSWVEVRVADDGPGIAPDHLTCIFDPLFTTKPVGQGTGLGLSISHKIVSEIGGTLVCESVLGQGATFIIRLPVTEETRAQEREPIDSNVTK